MTDDSQVTRILSPDEMRSSGIGPGAVLRQRYRLDGEIGRGGMGVVYRATDLELMREVAVKVLPDTSSAPMRASVYFAKPVLRRLSIIHTSSPCMM